jgi:hypothetical protein
MINGGYNMKNQEQITNITDLIGVLCDKYQYGLGLELYSNYSYSFREKNYEEYEHNYFKYLNHKYNHFERWLKLYHKVGLSKERCFNDC